MIHLDEFKKHLQSTAMSDKTVEAYVCGLNHYAKFFDEVTTENIQEYKRIALQTHKPKTVNLRLHALASYAKWQHMDVAIKTIQIQEPLFADNLMTPSDYKRILSYFAKREQWDWYILFRTLACTGVRISESYQIAVGDLKLSRKVILGKGTKTRVIWFPQLYRQEILPLLHGHKDDEPLVIHSADYIRTKLRKVQKRLRIRCHLSPHEFRRFYARQVYAKTKDVYLVKDLLGHRNIETTMKYLRISVANVSRRMSRIVDW